MNRVVAYLILIASVLCFGTARISAQTVQGVVTGTVTDVSGAAVPGADVKLTNEGTNITQTEKTGANGSYRFSLVPPGTYTVSVQAAGFADRVNKGVEVAPSRTVPLDFTLSVAGTSTIVEVTTATPLVQTATAEQALTVNTNTITNTALLTRNVFDLAFLAPQVTQGMNLNPAAGGARESGTAYLLNGADNNDNFSEGGINATPPLESVTEFTILTNNFSAQYGRAGGAVVSAAQKSGTNRVHGVLYEFNRNRSFNASDFFSNRDDVPKPKYIRNQFGGEVDGPIIKDKTFFAFAYDQVTLHTINQLNQLIYVPTPQELSRLQASAGPIAKQLLGQNQLRTSNGACPNQAEEAPDSIGHVGCIPLVDPVTAPQHNWYGRIDHNFSTNDRLSAILNFNWGNTVDQYGGGYATTQTAIPSTDLEHYHNLSLVHTHVFGPSVVNEFTAAHNRHLSYSYEGKNGQFTTPQIVIDASDYGLGWGFGPYSESTINAFTQDRWQIQDNISVTRGRHNFRVGGGYQYGQLYRNWDLGGPGQYEFGTVFGKTGAQLGVVNPNGTISGFNDASDSNFQNDLPYFQETSIDPRTGAQANAYRHYTMHDMYLFVQDDWKFNRRLTFNLGLRWDRYGAPTEVNNKVAQFTNLTCLTPTCLASAVVGPVKNMWSTQNHDFGPRVGFAWDVFGDGKTSFRGGYGISYDRIFDNVWSNGAWNPPFYALVDFDASGSDTINYSVPVSIGAAYVPNSLPGPAGRVSVRAMDVHMKDTSVQSFYAGVEHQFLQNFLVRASYQGSLGRHLPVLMYLNRYDGLRYNPTLAATPPPNSRYTGMNYRANSLSSDYNALITEVQKRFSHGFQFQFSYTWSKLMDYGSDLFSGETLQGSYSQPYYFVSNSAVNLERGPGAFDHTHNYKLNFIYELPFLRNQEGIFGKALGGWQLSAFYQAYSGHPLEIYNTRGRYKGNAKDPNGYLENIGGDYNLDGRANDRPTFVGQSVSAAYSGNSPADGIFTDNHKIGCGYPGAQSTNIASCNSAYAVGTPNALFVNPPGYGIRFGTLGRNVFRGPWFNGLDAALMKNFKLTESSRLQVRVEGLNVLNHPNFDGIDTNLNSSTFGRAQLLVGSAPARRLQLGARLTF